MINLLDQDHYDDYDIADSDNDDYENDNDSDGLIIGLQDQTYDDDSSSDKDSTTTCSIQPLINCFNPVDSGGDSDDNSFFDIPTSNENKKTTVQDKKTTENEQECALDEQELILANTLMSFPDSKKLLLLDSIGIANSGSTTHSSGSLCSADNIIDAQSKSGTTDASGNNMKVSKIFDLTCAVKNRFGESKGTVKFSWVRYSKNKPFTLISITQIMKKDFNLPGNNDKGIMLKKFTQQIVFDIPIQTK